MGVFTVNSFPYGSLLTSAKMQAMMDNDLAIRYDVRTTITVAGSHPWTCPESVTQVEIVLIGGGGGGGGSNGGPGGGGGSGYLTEARLPVNPGSTYWLLCGSLGPAGPPSGDGVAGGVSRFGFGSTLFASAAGGGYGWDGSLGGAGGAGGYQNGGGGNANGGNGGNAYYMIGSGGPGGTGGGVGGDAIGYAAGGGGGDAVTKAGGKGSNGIILFEWP